MLDFLADYGFVIGFVITMLLIVGAFVAVIAALVSFTRRNNAARRSSFRS